MATPAIDTTGLPGEAYELGSPLGEFPGRPEQPWWLIAIIVAAGLFAIGLGLTTLSDGSDLAWFFIILGAILIVSAARQAYSAIHNRGLRVILFDKGFARVRGSKCDVIPWDAITGVYQSITDHYTRTMYVITQHTGTSYTYTVWTEDHKSFVLGDKFLHVAELGTIIQKHATETLLPYYVGDYEDGETLNFNGLRLSKEGISTRKQTLPWDQVESIGMHKGVIIVNKRDTTRNWATQRVSMTPNLLVFLHIVHKVAGVRQMTYI